MKPIVLTTLGLCAGASMWAQEPPLAPREERFTLQPQRREEMRETIQIWRLHKMREALALTDEQSDAVLRAEENRNRKEQELRKRAEESLRLLRENLERNAPERDLAAQVDALLALRDERQKIERDFHNEMRRILDVRQQAKFILFEKEFQRRVREMMARARERRMGGGQHPGLMRRPPYPPMPPAGEDEPFDF